MTFVKITKKNLTIKQYKFADFLYECGSLSLILREGNMLKVFEMLREVFVNNGRK
jgi:hypothetical protein